MAQWPELLTLSKHFLEPLVARAIRINNICNCSSVTVTDGPMDYNGIDIVGWETKQSDIIPHYFQVKSEQGGYPNFWLKETDLSEHYTNTPSIQMCFLMKTMNASLFYELKNNFHNASFNFLNDSEAAIYIGTQSSVKKIIEENNIQLQNDGGVRHWLIPKELIKKSPDFKKVFLYNALSSEEMASIYFDQYMPAVPYL